MSGLGSGETEDIPAIRNLRPMSGSGGKGEPIWGASGGAGGVLMAGAPARLNAGDGEGFGAGGGSQQRGYDGCVVIYK